jgi:hypothetical protein
MSTDLPAANRIIGDHIIQRALARSVAAASATILTYPIEHQHARVAKIAAVMSRCRSAEAADHCIAKALRAYTAELHVRGMPGIVVSREVHALEAQVRGAVWRRLFPWVGEEKAQKTPQQRPRISRRRPPANQLDLFSYHGNDE